MDRRILSKRYLRGVGIEIGAMTVPWPLANGVAVKHVDRYSTTELNRQYPEAKPGTMVGVDIIDDGMRCFALSDASQDFVLSSHVLEHAEDPIGTLSNWARVTKSGGVILIALPEKNGCFDRAREATTWEHVLREFQEPDFRAANRERHYREFLSVVDKLTGSALESGVANCLREEAHIHFHAWDFAGLRELFYRSAELLGTFSVLEFHEVDCEALVALRRV